MGLRGRRGAGFLHAGPSSETNLLRRGCRRSRRRQDGGERAHGHWGDVSDCGSFDSYDEINSSSDAGSFGVSRRKKVLDDALFEFFSNEAVKSLKRDFSKFCRDSDIWIENKRPRVSGIGKDSFHLYSSKYFFEVLHRLTGEQKGVIQKFGFGCLLSLSKTYIPSPFTRWLACCVDTQCSQIIVDDKIMNLSKDSLHYVLGLPNAGADLVENSEAGLQFIMSMFHLSEVPNITFFGNKLNSNESLTDPEVFVCFMQIALNCFLCPSSSDRLDTKYIHQLGDPERSSSFDVCQVLYNHLIRGLTKFIGFIKAKGRKPKVFEFCSYALAVYYLDSLDFGVHVAGSGVPRAVSWRGDMIEVYSELDRKSKRCFGRRRMREDLASCYLNAVNISKSTGENYELLSTQHKEIMHDKFGMTLSGQTIDGIFEIFKSINNSPLVNNKKAERLAHNVLQFLADGRPWFKSSYFADTPAAVANKPVDKTSSIKAPEMHPVAKVKSRLSLRLPDNSASPLCQDDLISPIGRMALSPFPDAKDPSKAAVPSVLDNLFAKTDKGSRQDPIPVADKTSKTVLVEKSPECTITGTSILKDRQAKALEDVDAVYNRTVHGSSSHVIPLAHKEAAGKTPIRDVSHVVDVDNLPDVGHNTGKQDLVILQPKTLLVFPLASNKRFPVTDEDIMYYCAIVEIAYTKGIQKTYALEYHGVHCSYISLGQTLMRDGHIDNFLIPCFCRKLFEDNHPSKSGRHYFFSYIGESILELNDTVHEKLVTTSFFGASLASKGKRLDYSDRLFFPICHSDHWFTFVVDFKWKLFIFLDSLYGAKSDYQLAVQGPLMENFVILWKKVFKNNGPDFKKFNLMVPNVPRQRNLHDCGVFTMKGMEVFDPTKDMRKEFSIDDVGHIRIQYANKLFFHKGNRADRSLVTNFFVKEDFMRQLH